MVRIGILSVAHMHADSYIRAVQAMPQAATVTGLYHPDQETALAYRERYQVPMLDNPEAVIAASDAVIVTAENARHRLYVEAALQARKPVLCEKPLATTFEDGAAMVELSRQVQVPLYMALPVRFVPSFHELKAVVQQGRLGRVLAMVGTNHGSNPGGWFIQQALSGGGALADHTPHVVDLMRWLVQDEVQTVYAEVSERMTEQGIDDCALLTLEFEHGIVATLDASWSRLRGQPGAVDVTLEVVGTQGVVAWDAFRPHLEAYWREPRIDGVSARYIGYGENMDALLIREFVQSVASGQPGPTIATGLDGLRTLEVALAAYESANKGQAVTVSSSY
jgi:UDP-N-acetylglucosamine 3-dehydrogenase